MSNLADILLLAQDADGLPVSKSSYVLSDLLWSLRNLLQTRPKSMSTWRAANIPFEELSLKAGRPKVDKIYAAVKVAVKAISLSFI